MLYAHRTHRGPLAVLFMTACVAILACSSPPPSSTCVAGMSVACACVDGRTGAQTCGSEGTFGICECAGGSPDAGVAPDAGSDAPDAGTARDAGGDLDAATALDAGGGRDAAGGLSVTRTSPVSDLVHVRDTVTVQLAVQGGPIDGVELLLDGSPLVSLAAPYTYGWDTRGTAEGSHEIVARAVRGAEQAFSAPLTVVVDRTSPRVVSRIPVPDAPNVWLGDSIVVEFDEPLIPTTVNDSSVAISTDSSVGLSKTMVLSDSDRRLSMQLTTLPAVPSVVRVDVTAGPTDRAGNPVLADAWSFPVDAWVRAGGVADVPEGTAQASPYLFAISDDGSTPCVTFGENATVDDTVVRKLVVSCFDGTRWLRRGDPLSSTPLRSAFAQAFVMDRADRPIVVWNESEGDEHQVFVARWEGAAWVRLGSITASTTRGSDIAIDSTNEPVLVTSDAASAYVQRWDGSAFVDVGPPLSHDSGSAYVSMVLTSTDEPIVSVADCHVHAQRSGVWAELGAVGNSNCRYAALAIGPDDRPVAASYNSTTGSTPRVAVDRWLGAAWARLTTSFGFSNGYYPRVTVGDDLVPVFAFFDATAGQSNPRVMRHDSGTAWLDLGSVDGDISGVDLGSYRGGLPAVLVHDAGDLYVYRRNSAE